MIRSATDPHTKVEAPSLQCGTDHLEPFNGSLEMLSMRSLRNELVTAGPHRVVLTARVATGSVSSMTVVLPWTAK